MAVKIRLKRMGKIRAPFYRVVVADGRTKRDGRAIEEIGRYVPTQEPSLIEIDSERAQYWLSVGAQPTEQVAALLKVTGDWQKFKGEEGAEGTLRTAEPRRDKKSLYEAALAAADGKEVSDTPTSKAKKDEAKKDEAKADKKADTAKADKKAEEKADEAAAAEVAAESPAEATADAEAPAAGSTAEAAGAEPETEVAAVVEGDATDGGFGPDSAAATEDGSAPEGFTVKGNKDSMKFHVEGSRWYDQTTAEVWFRTAEAAEAAGFEPAGGAAAQSADTGAEIGTDKTEG